jgi:hypothetical protein
MAVMDEAIWRHAKPSAEPPLQFTIRDLLIAQTVCAVCLGLIAAVGVFGLIAAFLATLAYKAAPVQPSRAKLKRCVVDVLGGILLPAAFLIWLNVHAAGEPLLLTVAETSLQILALLLWLTAGSRLGTWKALLAGIFAGGLVVFGMFAIMSLCFGVCALTYYGIGVLFFMPILTWYVYLANMLDAARFARIDHEGRIPRLPFSFGIAMALTVPILVILVAGPETYAAMRSLPWPQGWFGDFWPTARL